MVGAFGRPQLRVRTTRAAVLRDTPRRRVALGEVAVAALDLVGPAVGEAGHVGPRGLPALDALEGPLLHEVALVLGVERTGCAVEDLNYPPERGAVMLANRSGEHRPRRESRTPVGVRIEARNGRRVVDAQDLTACGHEAGDAAAEGLLELAHFRQDRDARDEVVRLGVDEPERGDVSIRAQAASARCAAGRAGSTSESPSRAATVPGRAADAACSRASTSRSVRDGS